MKRIFLLIISIFSLILTSALFSSCEDMFGDYLEKAPGVDVTEDTIFSSADQVNLFLTGIYEYGIHANLSYAGSGEVVNRAGYANPEATMFGAASDEAKCATDWYGIVLNWNKGAISANLGWGDIDARFNYRFKAIRMISILIDRIGDVPASEMGDAEKRQFIAEAKTIRAMNYFEMFKRYGGVPIIKERLGVDSDLMLPRNSIESVVNFIVQDCDEAIPDLKNNYIGADDEKLKGRIHKGVAHAIKSKTLLYAASDLFNRDKPYLSYGNGSDSILCYGAPRDVQKWVKAAEAAAATLTWAEGAGCKLINTSDPDTDYQTSWDKYDNEEIILADKSQASTGNWIWPWGEFSRFFPPNKGYGGTSPTLNFVMKYETQQGTKQVWNPVGVTGSDLQEIMLNLDRRFKQTVYYNMGYMNKDISVCPLYQEAIDEVERTPGVYFEIPKTRGARSGAITKCVGGFWQRKHRPTVIDSDTWKYVPNSTIYQLNEIYLNYAEAVLEAFGTLDAKSNNATITGREALNIIRDRAGQPRKPGGYAPYASEKEWVRNERAIELAFDNHRFWDIRRWMIAEQPGVMKGDMLGIKINAMDTSLDYLNQPTGSGFKYTPYVFEQRRFYKKMYLHPFNVDEVNKGYLLQNPGY